MILLSLTPALAAIIYAVYRQLQRGNSVYVFLLALGGFIAIFNASLMYLFFMQMPVSPYLRCIQQLLSCMIVPIAYTYFSMQMGRNLWNNTTVMLWSMIVFLLIPTGIYSVDLSVPESLQDVDMSPMMMYFFYHGHMVFAMHLADFLILIQGFLTLLRMYSFLRTFQRYHITLSHNIHYFVGWWLGALMFILFTSLYTLDEISQNPYLQIYYIGVSILLTWIYVLFSMDFDLRPILKSVRMKDLNSANIGIMDHDDEEQNEDADNEEFEEQVVENIDTFLHQTRIMAANVQRMMNENRFLDPSFTADVAIQELGTNRTYFYRMIKAEFNCSFAEMINRHRLERAARLLKTTSLSVQDIAEQCGYINHSSFSRKFTAVYGITPSKYRENRQQ